MTTPPTPQRLLASWQPIQWRCHSVLFFVGRLKRGHIFCHTLRLRRLRRLRSVVGECYFLPHIRAGRRLRRGVVDPAGFTVVLSLRSTMFWICGHARKELCGSPSAPVLSSVGLAHDARESRSANHSSPPILSYEGCGARARCAREPISQPLESANPFV